MFKNSMYIPSLIFGVLSLFTLVICGFIYIAYSTFTGEVTEKAYQKGLDFGKIYKTSLMQADDAVKVEISIINQSIYLTLNTVFEDYTLEAKVVKPVSFEYDKALNFRKIDERKFQAIMPELEYGNWEVRVKIITTNGKEYVFNRRFLLASL